MTIHLSSQSDLEDAVLALLVSLAAALAVGVYAVLTYTQD